jgi:tRNA(Glu) U13 pseudouridine synthase TruD
VSPEGSRRSLRALVQGLEASWEPQALRLRFFLPPGSYATTLVEELGLGG